MHSYYHIFFHPETGNAYIRREPTPFPPYCGGHVATTMNVDEAFKILDQAKREAS